MTLAAKTSISQILGDSQPQLVPNSDDQLNVTEFHDNPQCKRLLAAGPSGSRLVAAVDSPKPPASAARLTVSLISQFNYMRLGVPQSSALVASERGTVGIPSGDPCVHGPVERRCLRVRAIKHVRRMRGGAQSHLMLCEDGFFYVVKLQNNPQHTRVLVNDWLGTRLGELIQLPVPVTAIVSVEAGLLQQTPELSVERCGHKHPFTAGLSFGSRYVISPLDGRVYDYLPEPMIADVRNLRDFAGVLALDKWTCNADGRQVAFWKKSREKKFRATFIDQGYCFNAGEWSFPNSPLLGVFGRNDVYQWITGWESFEPWLSRIENFPESCLWALTEELPPEWYNADTQALTELLTKLLERRSQVRELIWSFKESSRNPFPNWRDS